MSEWTVEEATIADVHARFREGSLTAVQLVDAYLERIETLDRSGPSLNSIITVSTAARDEARALDEEFAKTGELSGPLHGVPVLVKDQIETAGIVTTFGSSATGEYLPKEDAAAIARLKAAGAINLAKTTMPYFATSSFSTSSRSEISKNPYDLSRDPGGSSSGSAAAVAANLGLVAIGEDTGGSIRLPASWCNLVGVRVTPGLISRTGMSSLVVPQDTSGPMTRTVEDAARLLDVMVGFDPADPYTAAVGVARRDESFVEALKDSTLEGKRIGVLREVFGLEDDPDGVAVNETLDVALAQLTEAGATLVDVEIADLMHFVGYTSIYFSRSLQDMNAFIAERPNLGVESITQIYADKKFHPKLDLLEGIATGPATLKDDPEFLDRTLAQGEFQRRVIGMMLELELDAIAFPDTRLPAPTHDDVYSDRWTCLTYPTNTVIASQLHFPAVTVPAGFTGNGLPVGLELMSVPYDEVRLLQLARAVEKATGARRAPELDHG